MVAESGDNGNTQHNLNTLADGPIHPSDTIAAEVEKQPQSTTTIISRDETASISSTYSDVVYDLSTLAGLPHAFEQSSGPPTVTHGKNSKSRWDAGNAVGGEPQSYYFPSDPDIPGWRPVVMRMPYLALLSLISIGMAGAQEYLLRVSLRKGYLLRFESPQKLSVDQYFLWRYLPTMLTVLYGIAYQASDLQVRRLEPYTQLAAPQGARSGTAFLLVPADPWTWYRAKSWRVYFSTLCSLLAVVAVPSLQSASLGVAPMTGSSEYAVYVKLVWSRLLTSVLCLVAFLSCLLIFALRAKTGLLSNPQGILAILSMSTKSHVLQDFKNVSGVSSDADIRAALANRRYVLYKSSIWQGEWHVGSIPSPKEDADGYKKHREHSFVLPRRLGFPSLAYIASLFAIVPILLFTPANSIIEHAPFIFTAIGVIVKILWAELDNNVRLTEPYWHLVNGNAPPRTLRLDYEGDVIFTLPFRALANRHYMLAAVAINTVLLDPLTVCLSSFGVNGQFFFHRSTAMNVQGSSADLLNENGQTFTSFWVSLFLSVAILVSLCVTAGLIWKQRGRGSLPRKPGSIAFVLANCASSKCLVDVIDTETQTTAMIEHILHQRGKTYGMGFRKGRDGYVGYGIDEEPLLVKSINFAQAKDMLRQEQASNLRHTDLSVYLDSVPATGAAVTEVSELPAHVSTV